MSDIVTDFKPALSEIFDFLKESAGDQWEATKGQVEEYLLDSEKRYLLVLEETLTGNLTPEYLAERAKNEVGILESQAISIGIMSAKFSQDLVQSTVLNLLTTVIGTVIAKLKEKIDNGNNTGS